MKLIYFVLLACCSCFGQIQNPSNSQPPIGVVGINAFGKSGNIPALTFDVFTNFGACTSGSAPTATCVNSSTVQATSAGWTWFAAGGAGLTISSSGPTSSLPASIKVNGTTYSGSGGLNFDGVTATSGSNVGFYAGETSNSPTSISVGFTIEWSCDESGDCGNVGGVESSAGGDYADLHVSGAVCGFGNACLETGPGVSTQRLAVTANTPYRVNLQLNQGPSATNRMTICSASGTVLQTFTNAGAAASNPMNIAAVGFRGEEPTTAGYNYYWRNVVVSLSGQYSTTSCF